jgi:hypothetical protein
MCVVNGVLPLFNLGLSPEKNESGKHETQGAVLSLFTAFKTRISEYSPWQHTPRTI